MRPPPPHRRHAPPQDISGNHCNTLVPVSGTVYSSAERRQLSQSAGGAVEPDHFHDWTGRSPGVLTPTGAGPFNSRQDAHNYQRHL